MNLNCRTIAVSAVTLLSAACGTSAKKTPDLLKKTLTQNVAHHPAPSSPQAATTATQDAQKALQPPATLGALKPSDLENLNCSTRIRPLRQMQHLTKFQLEQSMTVMFGASAMADLQTKAMLDNFSADLVQKGFDTESKSLTIQKLDAAAGLSARLSTLASTTPTIRQNLEAFTGKSCNQSMSLETTCGKEFASALMNVLYGQPADENSLNSLLSTYSSNKSKYGEAKAYSAFLTTLLLSPQTRLRFDNAELSKSGEIDAWSLATRLSFAVTSSPPDLALRAKVVSGEILKPDILKAEAKRLMRTPQGRKTLQHFSSQWLNVALTEAPPPMAGFVASQAETDAVRDASKDEIKTIFERAVLDKNSSLKDFYGTTEVVPKHAWLAKIYGVNTSSTPVNTTNVSKKGLLTRAAFSLIGGKADVLPLAHRGYSIKVTMLCGSIGAFPNGVDLSVPSSAPDVMSSRQYFKVLTENPSCASCHVDLNSFGFAMAGISTTGEQLAKESVKNRKTLQSVLVDVDESTVATLDGTSTPFANPTELSDGIGKSKEAQACFAYRYNQFVVGWKEPAHCGVQSAYNAGSKPSGTMEDVLLEYVGSAEFRMR